MILNAGSFVKDIELYCSSCSLHVTLVPCLCLFYRVRCVHIPVNTHTHTSRERETEAPSHKKKKLALERGAHISHPSSQWTTRVLLNRRAPGRHWDCVEDSHPNLGFIENREREERKPVGSVPG